MYTTIEAQLDNGKLTGPEVETLPSQARVLVTLLESPPRNQRPPLGTRTTHVVVTDDAFAPLSESELLEWGGT